MKKSVFYFLFISLILISCSVSKQSNNASPKYIIVKDSADKILKGKISRLLIESDTAFGWFKENMKWGTANKNTVEEIKKHIDELSFVVFAGTWCHDTQNLLPIFYRMLDKAGFPDNKITIYGTDRNKITLKNIHTKYAVTNVPTFIVQVNNKEIGRVVEFGKYGDIEKEIGEIISNF